MTPADIRVGSGFSAKQLEEALNVSPPASGVAVWRLRDYLEEKIKEQGKEPIPSSLLVTNIWYKYK